MNHSLHNALRQLPAMASYKPETIQWVCGCACKMINRVQEYHNKRICNASVIDDHRIQLTFESPTPVEDLVLTIN